MNAWNPLLKGMEDVTGDFTGFEVKDFKAVLHGSGESGPIDDDVEDWLVEDEGDPGYELLSNRGITDSLLVEEEEDDKPTTHVTLAKA